MSSPVLEYNTPQLNVWLPYKQTPESANWQSHLLYVNAQHKSPPGLCAHSPPVHTVHPWSHFQTSRELYCEIWVRHHNHHQPHYKQWWEFIWGGNQQSYRGIYREQSSDKQHPLTHTSVCGDEAEQVNSFRFLWNTITENPSWLKKRRK